MPKYRLMLDNGAMDLVREALHVGLVDSLTLRREYKLSSNPTFDEMLARHASQIQAAIDALANADTGVGLISGKVSDGPILYMDKEEGGCIQFDKNKDAEILRKLGVDE